MANDLRLLEFRMLAQAVYGASWVYRLSADQNVNLRTVRRWASGAFQVPDDLIGKLKGMAASEHMISYRERMEFDAQVALSEGVPPVVVHAILRDVAASVLPDAPRDDAYTPPDDDE